MIDVVGDVGRKLRFLGVDVIDTTMASAIGALSAQLAPGPGPARSVFFVNAHTLNIAATDPGYRETLNRSDYVFGDGTGVRWAARLAHDVRLQDNVNGTDLVPALFAATAGRGLRYYLLGATQDAIGRAAKQAAGLFPGWIPAGHHHGYVDDATSRRVIDDVNAAKVDMLLVGMGNPVQERWIDRHKSELAVRLCLAVGGLFTYWSGDIVRARPWVRRLGYEWMHLLLSQPHKARRYLLGSPLFLARIAGTRLFGERFLR